MIANGIFVLASSFGAFTAPFFCIRSRFLEIFHFQIGDFSDRYGGVFYPSFSSGSRNLVFGDLRFRGKLLCAWKKTGCNCARNVRFCAT